MSAVSESLRLRVLATGPLLLRLLQGEKLQKAVPQPLQLGPRHRAERPLNGCGGGIEAGDQF